MEISTWETNSAVTSEANMCRTYNQEALFLRNISQVELTENLEQTGQIQGSCAYGAEGKGGRTLGDSQVYGWSTWAEGSATY